MSQLHNIVLHALQNKRRNRLFGLLATGTLGSILCLFLYTDPESFSTMKALLVLVLALVPPSFFAMLFWRLRVPERSEIFNVIEEAPEQIVWMYEYTADSVAEGARPRRMRSLMVRLHDGTGFTLPVEIGRFDELKMYILQKAPSVLDGNTAEYRAAYKSRIKT